MRVILFRGKRTDNGEWAYGVPTKDNHGEMVMVESTFECEEYNCCGANCLYVDENTVGQYTGLTDKNGTKIFEGDILGITNCDPDYSYITKVYLECNTLCVDVEGQDYDYTSIGFANDIWSDECDEVEILGNIHDNPELLRSDTE